MTERAEGRRAWRAGLLALLAVEVLGIAWLTLSPTPARPQAAVHEVARWWRLHDAPSWLADPVLWEGLLNVVLFVPFGLLSAAAFPRVRLPVWLVLGMAVSALIEISQRLLLPERTSTVADFVTNSVGMVLGAGATLLVRRWRRSRARSAPPSTTRPTSGAPS